MAEKFKQLWRNEYFQTIMMVLVLAAVVFGSWYGLQAALSTEYPLLAVASESMLPTLNVGDVIIVQGVSSATQIRADPINGDIVVYQRPGTDVRIVHRAIEVKENASGCWVVTKGDKNSLSDAAFPESALIGKVIARIPFVGNVSLFVNKVGNFYFLLALIIVAFALFLSLLTDEEEASSKKENRERELFGIKVRVIFSLILNFLLIGFTIFSFIGSFTFLQIGTEPNPHSVTVRGIYADLQFHETFVRQNSQPLYTCTYSLSHGLFTYKIDCLMNGSIRAGVPTLSWAQISILAIILLNARTLIKYLVKSGKYLKEKLAPKR